jgi:hypothetical protein
MVRANRTAATVDARDLRILVKRAEHDRDAAVAQQMSGGLIAAAGQIQVADPVLVEDAEGVHPFRRQVDAAFGRGGGDEENQLRADEAGQLRGNVVEEL